MLILLILLSQNIQKHKTFKTSDVHIGMEGYGLSTFQREKIDTFMVEITGKLPPSETGTEIILAELKGNIIDESGVLSGMSGSPVYINDKLLGAVAFSWPFSKKPICGIMPFSEMKKGIGKINFGSSGLTPIKSLLSVSGFPEMSMHILDSFPGNFHISSTVSGGKADSATPLLPGGVCGVPLVVGDGNISMMGTITEVIGDTIYAFGHHAFATGTSELPLCEGIVSSYLPSFYHSFKFMNPGKIIGTIISDFHSGIKAIIGRKPPMVECKININEHRKKYSITSMKNLVPGLSSFLLFANWIEIMGTFNSSTLKGNIHIYSDSGNMKLKPVMSGNYLHQNIYSLMNYFIRDIQNNRFCNIQIDSIIIDIKSFPTINRYRIKNFKLKKKIFRPEENITAEITVERYRESDTTVNFKFKAPDEDCKLLIRASGSMEFLRFEQQRLPLNFQFDNFSQWRDFINNIPAQDNIILMVFKEGSSISTKRGELRDLPQSLQNIIGDEGNTSYNFFPIKKCGITMKGPATGEIIQRIEVRR